MLVHRSDFQLRYCDTDRQGHINNAVYASIYESGRTGLFIESGLLYMDSRTAPVIVRLELDYVREMNWPGTAQVETVVHRIGNKSFQLRHRVSLNGELVSRALCVMAVMDTTTRRAVPLNDAWRDVLTRYLDPDFV